MTSEGLIVREADFGALARRITERIAHVAVIGLGYVGLPLACAFADAGFAVVGYDVDGGRAERIRHGESYIDDVSSEKLTRLVTEGRLTATDDPSILSGVDVVVICVPTPYTKAKQPDLSYVIRAATEVQENLRANTLVILESTTYPGTTEEIVQPILEAADRQCGHDFLLAYSPERVDPGNSRFDLRNTPKIVGGVTPLAAELAVALYGHVALTVVPVSTPKVAEMAKLMENTFRHVNIGLVNEMAMLCGKLGIDIWEVIDAAATKPFGFMPFYPGPGVGGHCIPIDPYYFAWKAREHQGYCRFIELAGEINDGMPEVVVDRVADLLNERSRPLRGSRILVLGVAYKRDIADMRESPALKVIGHLLVRGAAVAYHDPHIPVLRVGNALLSSVPLEDEALYATECVVLLTDHQQLPYARIAAQAPLVLDTRNAFRSFQGPNIIRL